MLKSTDNDTSTFLKYFLPEYWLEYWCLENSFNADRLSKMNIFANVSQCCNMVIDFQHLILKQPYYLVMCLSPLFYTFGLLGGLLSPFPSPLPSFLPSLIPSFLFELMAIPRCVEAEFMACPRLRRASVTKSETLMAWQWERETVTA